MTLLPFAPQTQIEHRILAAQNGELSGDTLLREIAASNLYIPSHDDVQEDGSRFQPVLLDMEGQPFVAVYTALARVPKDPPYLLQTIGTYFFLRLPPGYGVMVNPGYDAQMLVPAQGVAAVQQDLRKA
ncbi:MAG TPA: SseB family protein [Rhizomicrobium sp.]|nr:SseB family protein [Rhizomicrobium sp.]